MGYPCFEVEVSRHGDPSRRRPWDVTFGIRASLFAPSTPSPEELLSAAAESGDAGSVAELLAAGADPTHFDASGLTPLMHAVVGGHAAAIRLLLDVGAPCIALSAFDRSIDPHTSLKTEADRERDLELELFRSGSAPPTVEGSMGALHRAGADVFLEDDLRADPAYHSYYSNGNINPRLPPPLFSKEAAAAQPETDEAALDKPDLGPFILKQARDAKVSGEGGGAGRALELAERTARALERRGEGAELELAMSLHVAAAIHCGLGRHADAIPVLERAVAVVTPPEGEGSEDQQPEENKGEEWALAVFSGWMQLGDTHAMLGHMDKSIAYYGKGLEIQMGALGERDLRIAFDAVSITLDATPPGLPDNDGGAVVVLVDVAEAGGRIAGDLGVFANTEARSFSVEGSLNLKNLFGYCETWDASGVLGLDQTMELSAGVAIPRIGPNVKDSLSWLDYIDGANEKIMHKEKPDEKPIENPDGKQNEQPDGSIPISSAEPKQEETTSPVDGSSADPEEDHVESAAVVIQSGIRTYIARQELSNHKDLVKLQVVICGHLVDCSATYDTVDLLKGAGDHGCCVVLANKKPLTCAYEDFEKLVSNFYQMRIESTVGTGLPEIASVTRLIASGDPVSRIVGSLSGTLGYVMSELEGEKRFSEAVKTAKSLGYTEPDPRDDLGGMDVARKALILARLLGQQISMENINVDMDELAAQLADQQEKEPLISNCPVCVEVLGKYDKINNTTHMTLCFDEGIGHQIMTGGFLTDKQASYGWMFKLSEWAHFSSYDVGLHSGSTAAHILVFNRRTKRLVDEVIDGLRKAHIRDGMAVLQYLAWLDNKMQENYGASDYFSEVNGSQKKQHLEIKLTEVSVSDKLEIELDVPWDPGIRELFL